MRRLFEGGVFMNISARKCGVYLRAAINRINTVLSLASLSTLVYTWVPANLTLGGNPNPSLPSRKVEKKS